MLRQAAAEQGRRLPRGGAISRQLPPAGLTSLLHTQNTHTQSSHGARPVRTRTGAQKVARGMMGPARLLGADTAASQTLSVRSGTGIQREGRCSRQRVPCGACLQSSGHQRSRQSTGNRRAALPSRSGRQQTASTLCAEDSRSCSSVAACSAIARASANSPGLLPATELGRSGQLRRPGSLSSSSAFIQHRFPLATSATTPRRLPPCSRKLPPCATSAMAPEGEGSASQSGREVDHSMMRRALELAVLHKGQSAPHPYFGCVIAKDGQILGEGSWYAQGTQAAELQALDEARGSARGATAYVNMEPGNCHGDDTVVEGLIQAGVARVVVGMRSPLAHHWGRSVGALSEAGVAVEILGEGLLTDSASEALAEECRRVNAALLFRAAHGVPFSILKYAMTLDGKIAASSGHAAWVTSPEARQRVFATRAESDAIIVGGNTVRRDNPRLTTRREGGHTPVRVVMSRTLKLPEDANLWDVGGGGAPTLVMTQRGAREDFQARLRAKGCEVVQFDFLTPRAVMDYCYQRGFLQVLWECGGTLSAPAVTASVIHEVMAFVAPKIIGGTTAPSPMGELGFVEMTQALPIASAKYQQVGPDMLVSGYLHPLPDPRPPALFLGCEKEDGTPKEVRFYKSWDKYGGLSNFSAHPIHMPYVSCPLPSAASTPQTNDSLAAETNSLAEESRRGSAPAVAATPFMPGNHAPHSPDEEVEWGSVEHFYQAQKFACTNDPLAQETVASILAAKSPEEAARLGRRLERTRPDLVRPDWSSSKLQVMYNALERKFTVYPQLGDLLLSTGSAELVEASPVDAFWGSGRDGQGKNHLGKHLMALREHVRRTRAEGSSRLELGAVNGSVAPGLINTGSIA